MIKYKRMNFVGIAYLFIEMCCLQEVFDMKYVLKTVIIGIIQGVTEFLPVSSSGHAAILKDVFGLSEESVGFDVLLHMGTLIAVCVFYRRDIAALAREAVRLVVDTFSGKRAFERNNEYRVLLIMIIVTTLPTAVVGFLLENVFETLFSSVTAVGFSLIITSVMLYISGKFDNGKKQAADITLMDALVVGIFQSCAITPGISRSGATTFAGRLSGFDARFAVRYSFLCSLPTVLGALVLKGKEIFVQSFSGTHAVAYVLAFVASAVVGYLSLELLNKISNKRRMKSFSVYCLLLGSLCIIYGAVKNVMSMI